MVVLTRFTDQPTYEHRREFTVAPWGRWELNLDELRVDNPTQVNAVVRIECEGTCWASSALWHAPIAGGAVPAVTPVSFVCQPATP